MRAFSVVLALALSACATARMHPQAELNSVASRCGLALGQVVQDEEEKRLLFVMQDRPSMAQGACVTQWARKNHLKAVFVGGVEFAQ